jgi:hypothetical protein
MFTTKGVFILFFLIFVFASGCGRNNNNNGGNENGENNILTQEQPAPTPEPLDGEDAPLPAKTLSILAPDVFEQAIRATATFWERNIQRRPEAERFTLEIELSTYDWEGRDSQRTRLETMLMAGDGYDLFFLDDHPLWRYAQSGFLRNIYDLIDESPRTSRDAFFLNPLQAMEINGGLYALPLSFGFTFASINSNLPEAFIERFLQKETVSLQYLLDMYAELIDQYPGEFGRLQFSSQNWALLANPFRIMHSEIARFVDLNNRTTGFTSDLFHNFANSFSSTFENWTSPLFTSFSNLRFERNDWEDLSSSYAFLFDSRFSNPGFAYFPASYFTNGIPITDTYGNLLIYSETMWSASTWATVCIPTAGDGLLALDFTLHLIEFFSLHLQQLRQNASWGEHSFGTPVLREFADSQIRNTFSTFIEQLERRDAHRLIGGIPRPYQVDTAVARWAEYNEMPMSINVPHIPLALVSDDIDMFMRGLMTTEQFAQQLENRVSLWLIE